MAHSFRRRSILLLIAFILASCSPTTSGGETPPVVTPKASETFQSGDGSFSFKTPENWFMLSFPNDTAILATKQELLNNPGAVPAGECEVVIGPVKQKTIDALKQTPQYSQIVKNDPPTANELLDLLLSQLNVTSASATTDQKVGSRNGTIATFTQTVDTQKTNGSLLIVETGKNTYIFVQTVAAEGQLETCQQTANQVAESATYQP